MGASDEDERRERRGATSGLARPLALGLALALALGSACAGRPPVVTKIVGGRLVEQRSISPDAYAHAARAMLLEEEDRLAEAADELRRALTFDPDSPELLARLAELLLALDRADEAAGVIARGRSKGETPPLLVAEAHLKQLRGDTGGAVIALRRARDLALAAADPTELEAVGLELAHAQVVALDVEGGTKTLREICAAAPTSATARTRLAALAWATGAFDEAEAALREALAIEPNLLDTRLTLAWLHAAEGRTDDARAAFQQALDRSEGALEIAAAYARYLVTLGKADEARQLADDLAGPDETDEGLAARVALERSAQRPDRAIALIEARRARQPSAELQARLDLLTAETLAGSGKRAEAIARLLALPQSSDGFLEARIRAGHLLLDAGRAADARRALEEVAADDDPDRQVELALVLALADEKTGHVARALERIAAALARRPDEPRLLLGQAAIEERRGRVKEALALAERILAKDPASVEALNFWGFVAADQGQDLPRAAKRVRAAMALEPGAGAIIDSVGWALLRLGDVAGAGRFLEQAARLEPEDPEVLAHLGALYARRGERGRAAETLRKALSHDPEPRLRRELEAQLGKLGDAGPLGGKKP